MRVTCSGCGSLLADDAILCDSCGTPREGVVDFDQSIESEDLDHGSESGSGGIISGALTDELESVHCNQCGWKNPSGARFCSRCGEKLQEGLGSGPENTPGSEKTSSSPEMAKGRRKAAVNPPATHTDKAVDPAAVGGVEPGAGKRMGIIVGAALLFIIAVFMIFNMGDKTEPAAAVSADGAPIEPPLSTEFAAREAELRSEMASLTGELRVDKQRELLTLYFTSGRFDLAGAQAEQIGLATGLETAWIDAGNFYYDWMESSPPQNKGYYSQKASGAYMKALEINPDNLDVRTDMAVAYLYDPENSMLAIQETARVLEVDSNHVQANFNRGIMLWQIDRIDEAVGQFEKVIRLVDDPEEPIYQRATEALSSLRQGTVGF